jgi:integrase
MPLTRWSSAPLLRAGGRAGRGPSALWQPAIDGEAAEALNGPCQHQRVMKGIRRTIGTARDKKTPATHDILGQMLDACPDTLIGKRDRALLAFGFAGAFRRAERWRSRFADLVEVADGLRVVIRHSKTDQEGQGSQVSCDTPAITRLDSLVVARAAGLSTGGSAGPVVAWRR